MLRARVRLQRKFTPKNRVTYSSLFWSFIRTQLIFECTYILCSCVLNLSLQLHLQHVIESETELFICELWTTEHVANANLALAITTVLLLPYLLLYESLTWFLLEDLIFTALFVHSVVCALYSFKISLSYVLYLTVVGGIAGIIASKGWGILQQRSLIKEINLIERSDKYEEDVGLKLDYSQEL